MTGYFTSNHFKLLNKWKGQKSDASNPEQKRAYDELKQAYEVTEAWAEAVKSQLCPAGRVDVRKRPTNQANNFAAYNWAKIFPRPDAPKQIAFTVGIEADSGFVVKIDTVGLDEFDPVRQAYLALRGEMTNASPIVATLPATEGLHKTFDELVTWSVEAIRDFSLRYEDVAERLDLTKPLADEDLLKHFDAKLAFKEFRGTWSPDDRAIFCRLARIVHAAGLDWWHTGNGIQVRFGRKNPGSERAMGVLGTISGRNKRKISWTRQFGDIGKSGRTPLSEEKVSQIEAAFTSERSSLDAWLTLETERPGLWPDELREDPEEPGEDMDDEMPSDADKTRLPINRIYYGPPGTGKTYALTKLLKHRYETSMTSVAPDEWRNQLIAENIATLTWWEGIAAALYDLGEHARVGDLLDHEFILAIGRSKGRSKNVRNTLWRVLQAHAVLESGTVKVGDRTSPAVFDKSRDSIWSFAGDWRESCADVIALVDQLKAGPPHDKTVHKRYSFVTFHQSYGYEEFVEGLRPTLSDDGEAGGVSYEIRPGTFKDLCNRARMSPDQRFAMVIDEINRGNISKIFGELITLIEADKREGAEHTVSVTLPYSGESFSVPPNVDIIGTMNTADRSLALLDTALRRRFDFVAVMPDARDESDAPLEGLRVTSGNLTINVPQMLAAINQRIEALYDRDHTIGHAYFAGLKSVPDGESRMAKLGEVFRNRIVPLLEEYFFEDWNKIRLVLADNQKAAPARFIIETNDRIEDLAQLFGDDHGLDTYNTKSRYAVQNSAFSNPEAYVGVYQSSRLSPTGL